MTAFFEGRALFIATMHQKEKVLAPLLVQGLHVKCQVPAHFDTDQFGTFSGEIPRPNSILDTARAKCEFVHAQFGCDLVVASEGTFGPHPSVPFIPCDHEFLLLKDFRKDLEITGSALSTETNYAQQEVSTFDELLTFARSVHYPAHALILRSATEGSAIYKGVNDDHQLAECFTWLRCRGPVVVETDMRAMFNPTRMTVIAEATNDLISRAHSLCPVCDTPGFGVSVRQPGLPCRTCGNPTQSVLKEQWVCQRCQHQCEKWFPRALEFENPMYCDYCNP